jgi:hypothetical protein
MPSIYMLQTSRITQQTQSFGRFLPNTILHTICMAAVKAAARQLPYSFLPSNPTIGQLASYVEEIAQGSNIESIREGYNANCRHVGVTRARTAMFRARLGRCPNQNNSPTQANSSHQASPICDKTAKCDCLSSNIIISHYSTWNSDNLFNSTYKSHDSRLVLFLIAMVGINERHLQLLLALAIYIIYVAQKRLRHPLRKFPGPFLAGYTHWYRAYYDMVKDGGFLSHLEGLHRTYGKYG